MFNSLCWRLNVLHMGWLAAGLRYAAWVIFMPLMRTGYYENPTEMGVIGWITIPLFGCVAFFKPDGSKLFKW